MLLLKNNIGGVMGWDDQKFQSFLINWEKAHEIHITSQRSSFMYSKEYFDFLLPLFFVINQMDLNLGTKVVDAKTVLLTLLCFYLVNDTTLNRQTETSLQILKVFLASLVELNLISRETMSNTNTLLRTFLSENEEVVSDRVHPIDVQLVKDLLTSANPIIVSKSHAMFYYDEPGKATFLVKKPYPKPVDFFDEMFKVSQTIANTFLRSLYSERLHRLMDTEHKKSIFPF